MQHRRLGKSAIVVSDISMGTMTFGSQTNEAEAFRILDRCFDAGINFTIPPRAIRCRLTRNGSGAPKRSSGAG